jgi:tetratricopeptide (TPR) repeat protein
MHRHILKSLLLAVCLLTAAGLPAAVQQSAAPKIAANSPVAKPLRAAQDAVRAGNWKTALAALDRAQDAPGISARDRYAVDTLLAYVLYRQKNYSAAVTVYERLVASGFVPRSKIAEREKAIAQMHFYAGHYADAVAWADRYLSGSAQDRDMQALRADAYFRLRDYKNAAAGMQKAVVAAQRAGSKPDEAWLRVWNNACYATGDSCTETALKDLARYYGKPKDWSALLQRQVRGVDDDKVLFGYRKLMFELGVLTNAEDYEEMVFAALDAGFPSEAQRMLDRGKAVLAGPDAPPGHYGRLVRMVKEKATDSSADLAALERNASNTPKGQDDAVVGRRLLGREQYRRAIDALNRAIRQGGLADTDETKMHLGIAYLKAGEADLAERTFESVPGKSKWRELAELWTLRSGSSGKNG